MGTVSRDGDPPTPVERAGRPRNAELDQAISRATLELLDEVGYGRLTLEHVARRAGTAKPAIYRRWPNRQRLVLAALAARLGSAEAPDTSCTLCDLDECLKVFVAAFKRMPPDVLGPLFADCAHDPELRAAFAGHAVRPAPHRRQADPRSGPRARRPARRRRPGADPRPHRVARALPSPLRARPEQRRRDRARGRGPAAGHRKRLPEAPRAQPSHAWRLGAAPPARMTPSGSTRGGTAGAGPSASARDDRHRLDLDHQLGQGQRAGPRRSCPPGRAP